MELGTKFDPLEQLQVLAHLAARTQCVSPLRLGFQSRSGRHSRLPLAAPVAQKKWHANLLLQGTSPSVLESCRSLNGVHRSKAGYNVDNVILRIKVRNVTRIKGLHDCANFSHRDLILFFKHELRVKIRCDRKCLERITFEKRWVIAVILVVRKEATLESSFPFLPAYADVSPVSKCCPLSFHVSSMIGVIGLVI